MGKWNSSSNRFLCEVMRSEAGQDCWNNIIRSLREKEQGQIIRLNPAEWKCMGGKVLTPPSLSLIQFPALTLCRWYSCRAVRPRPTNFNVRPHLSPLCGDGRMESKAENMVLGGEGGWKRHKGTILKFEVRKDNCYIHSCVSHSFIHRYLIHVK